LTISYTGDERLGCVEIRATYHVQEYLFWRRCLANFPHGRAKYYPRDMASIALREVSNTELFVVMTSVVDGAIPNEIHNVHAHLDLSGWRIIRMKTGICIVYITQIDLNGHLPKTWLDYTAG